MEPLPDNIDDIYVSTLDNSTIIYQVHINNNSNIINKIESLIVHDFIDNHEYYSNSSNSSNSMIKTNIAIDNTISEIETVIKPIELSSEEKSEKPEKPEKPEKSEKIETTPTNSLTLSVPHSFFECFNDNTSINNAIACDKLTTNYVFDNETFKDDISPFEESVYDKKKVSRSRWNIIAISAFKVLGGGTWFN